MMVSWDMLKQGVTPNGVAFLFWSDEHEKTEEKTKREIGLAGLAGHYGSDKADISKASRSDSPKMKTTHPFYKSKQWERKRKAILRRDEYLCQECKRYGKATPAKIVHHIIPFEQRPDLKLCSDNLISLCFNCHEQMHNKMTNELTDKGLEWVERVERKLR